MGSFVTAPQLHADHVEDAGGTGLRDVAVFVDATGGGGDVPDAAEEPVEAADVLAQGWIVARSHGPDPYRGMRRNPGATFP